MIKYTWTCIINTLPFDGKAQTDTLYYRLSIFRSQIQHDILHSTNIVMIKLQSDISSTNDTPYLALTGELWDVFREFFEENDRDISRAQCINSMLDGCVLSTPSPHGKGHMGTNRSHTYVCIMTPYGVRIPQRPFKVSPFTLGVRFCPETWQWVVLNSDRARESVLSVELPFVIGVTCLLLRKYP